MSSLDLRLLSGLWARLLSLSLASSKVNCKYWSEMRLGSCLGGARSQQTTKTRRQRNKQNFSSTSYCAAEYSVILTLFLSLDSILSLQDGLRSCLSVSPPAIRVAEVVTVVVAVDPGDAGTGEEPPGLGDEIASCCSSVVLCAFSCCCFFLTSCSADLRSSSVTPWVERRVSLTLLACAFLWISCSSSLTGGTKDLQGDMIRLGGDWLEVTIRFSQGIMEEHTLGNKSCGKIIKMLFQTQCPFIRSRW